MTDELRIGAVYDIEFRAPFLTQRPVKRYEVTYRGSRTTYGKWTESDDAETEHLAYEFQDSSGDILDVRAEHLIGYQEIEDDAS